MHNNIAHLLFVILVIQAFYANCCIQHEREALLEFKVGVKDPSNRLASWSGNKCCKWEGIICSNQTGRVIKLDLGCPEPYNHNISLFGNFSSSLLALTNLEYLDLSYNKLRFPDNFSFQELKYLNLSGTYFQGGRFKPPQLGNLSRVQYLDLSGSSVRVNNENIHWFSHLSSLRYLDMSFIQLYDVKEWIQPFNKLTSLEVLILVMNRLAHIPELHSVNFTSLRMLKLTHQYFNSTIPQWIGSLYKLTYLDLGNCNFIGQLPDALGNLTSLRTLVLDSNSLHSQLPPLHNLTKLTTLSLDDFSMGQHGDITQMFSKSSHGTWRSLERLILRNNNLTGIFIEWIGEMSNLKYLDLSGNYLSGSIPDNLGNLTLLVELDLSYNNFIGILTDVHLDRLSKLETLILDSNLQKLLQKSIGCPLFNSVLLG